MSYLIKPEGYKPLLDLKQTELGIKQIKEFFQLNLSSELRLRRVTAPLFVLKGMGINDDLNGVERAVSFPIKDLGDAQAEVVHSLAKWKRLTLAEYGIEPGYGIYTDMNAIRADEELGNLHSLYVDQWDWERVITEQDRNIDFLKEIVTRIYAAMVLCCGRNETCRARALGARAAMSVSAVPRAMKNLRSIFHESVLHPIRPSFLPKGRHRIGFQYKHATS